jgi:hypothetical protein
MVDVTPIVPTLAAVYTTSGAVGALADEAMNEVNMTSMGYQRYTVYEITDPAKRYLDRAVVPVFQADSGGDSNFKAITGTVEYAGGRIVLATPRGSADVVRANSGSYYTTITKIFGASVSKIGASHNLVDVPLLGDAYVRRKPTVRDFDLSVDSYMVLTQAEALFDDGPANADLVFRHLPGGTAGNAYTVEINDPGKDATLSIAVTGTDVVIELAYATGAITSTAVQVMSAINSDPACRAIGLGAYLPGTTTGSGKMVAEGPLTLAGGLDANDFEALYGTPLIVTLYVNTTNDTRMEGYAYIETEGYTFDPKNVVMDTLTFKGDGPLYYRPA